MKVAKKFADAGKKVTFAVSSASEFGQELSEYGIAFNSEKGVPVVGARDGADQKFSLKTDFRLLTETYV
jgi:protein disulfide isomerase family A protein 3